jgi:site-specific recombinase XerD
VSLPDLVTAAGAGLSDSAKRALKFDWQVFTEWCATRNAEPFPATPELAHTFIVEQANNKSVATLARYRATIGKIHKKHRQPSPFGVEWASDAWMEVKREHGAAQNKKQAATLEFAKSVVGKHPAAVRDRAILTFGLMTALRGSELCALTLDDLEFRKEGVVVQIRNSKTDQFGEGRVIGIEYAPNKKNCPVRAVKAWIDLLDDTTGPLLRRIEDGQITDEGMTATMISDVVKSVAVVNGLDAKKYGSHSLRIGYINEAIKAGQDWSTIMEQTGHKKLETVKGYARVAADPFKKSRTGEIYKRKT